METMRSTIPGINVEQLTTFSAFAADNPADVQLGTHAPYFIKTILRTVRKGALPSSGRATSERT